MIQFSSVQSFSRVQLFATPWMAARQAFLSITNSWSLLKLMSIESVMPSNHLILCCHLLLLPSILLTIRVFFNESVLHIKWPKTGVSASASVLPMNIWDWFHLRLTTLISLQCKGLSRVFSSTTVWKHQLFGTQASVWSETHICTWLLEKNIALTRWTFVSKMMSLLFNMLSRLVIALLQRSKCLLISWLQSLSAVTLEPSPSLFPLFPHIFAMKWWDQMPRS